MMKSEYKVGVAGIVALVALFLGINFLKGKALFSTTKEYYVSFQNANGLAKSSSVYIDGYDVGIVSNVIYDFNKPGNILVEISVDPKLVLYHGCRVTLDPGLMGGCTMNIASSQDKSRAYAPGDTIQGSPSIGVIDKAGAIMPKVNEIAEKLDTLITALNKLATDPKLAEIVSNVERASEDLTVTTRHLNSLVGQDIPRLVNTYNKVGENMLAVSENLKTIDLQPTLDSVSVTISNVNDMVRKMNDPNGTLGALMSDRSLYNSLNNTVSDMDSLMVDLKKNPKRYVHFSVFGRKNK